MPDPWRLPKQERESEESGRERCLCRGHTQARPTFLPAESTGKIAIASFALGLRLLLFSGLALLGMHQPRHANAQRIQSQHGRGKNAHVYDVRSGRNDSR